MYKAGNQRGHWLKMKKKTLNPEKDICMHIENNLNIEKCIKKRTKESTA